MSDELIAGKVVRIGEGVTLILGDSEQMERIEADVIVSDPPYGIKWNTNYQFGLKNSSAKYAKNLVRKKHDAVGGDDKPFDPSRWLAYGTAVLWGCNYFMDALPAGSLFVWDKRTYDGKAFMSQAEAAWCSRVGAVRMFHHVWQGFSRASENSEHHHPTQKPVALMAWCMDEAKIPQGATVLDPYMGSGSTAIACIRTGRKFIGIERDPVHFATAEQRIRRELEAGTFNFAAQPASASQQPLL